MAYDYLKVGMRADRIFIFRIQYGVKDDFDKVGLGAKYIDLPTELANLPFEPKMNRGFSSRGQCVCVYVLRDM